MSVPPPASRLALSFQRVSNLSSMQSSSASQTEWWSPTLLTEAIVPRDGFFSASDLETARRQRQEGDLVEAWGEAWGACTSSAFWWSGRPFHSTCLLWFSRNLCLTDSFSVSTGIRVEHGFAFPTMSQQAGLWWLGEREQWARLLRKWLALKQNNSLNQYNTLLPFLLGNLQLKAGLRCLMMWCVHQPPCPAPNDLMKRMTLTFPFSWQCSKGVGALPAS